MDSRLAYLVADKIDDNHYSNHDEKLYSNEHVEQYNSHQDLNNTKEKEPKHGCHIFEVSRIDLTVIDDSSLAVALA